MHEFSSEEKITCCFSEIGCDDDFIKEFIRLNEQKEYDSQICMLTKQRQELLDQVHTANKRIDCIDYMIYKLKQEQCARKSD